MKLSFGKNIAIKVLVLALFLFFFSFLPTSSGRLSTQSPAMSDIPCIWTGVDRIVCVGDLHGAYEHFVTILKGTGLVDDSLSWTGGKTHLVQIGDVLDRGDRAKDIFELLMKLEAEAEAAGGKVHALIGNHEEMNLADTALEFEGYVTPGQFTSFISDRYRKKMEKKFSSQAGLNRGESSDYNFSGEWQRVIDKARTFNKDKGRTNYYRNLNRMYGDWILSHNVVVRINGILFVHAGISESFLHRNLEEINAIYRKELDAVRKAILTQRMPSIPVYEMEFYRTPNGPLWCRDFIQNNQEEYGDEVDRILDNYQAEYMVIGHTPVYALESGGQTRFEGRIWIVDTGISDFYQIRGGYISALIFEDGKFSLWRENLKRKFCPKDSSK